MRQEDRLNDKVIGYWIKTVTHKFLSEVQDEIKLLPHHMQDIHLTEKIVDPETGKKTPRYTAREQAILRQSMPMIQLDKLTNEQIKQYNTHWILLANVEITNAALVAHWSLQLH